MYFMQTVTTVFTIKVGTPHLLTILVLNFDIVHSTIALVKALFSIQKY